MKERAGSPEYFGHLYTGVRTEISRREQRRLGVLDFNLPIESLTDQPSYVIAVNQWRHFAGNVLGETIQSSGSYRSILEQFSAKAFSSEEVNSEAIQIILVMHPYILMPQAISRMGRLADLPLAIALLRSSNDAGDYQGVENEIIANQRAFGMTDDDLSRARKIEGSLKESLDLDQK